ncbi:LuxR family transcriptional regulator [Nocardia alni]|uniref:LuxR family transcriptional regulator n=1 Tax=Nocardia alni TaxID=2815723 RepID=UPI001C2427AE|nr:LuxR family transcriptional regulator [Nocardia alni]
MQRSVARDRDLTPIVTDTPGARPVRARHSDDDSLKILLRSADPARLRAARAVAVLDIVTSTEEIPAMDTVAPVGPGSSVSIAMDATDTATVELVAALSDADPDEMRGTLHQLAEAGLLEQARFAHPAIAAHVLRDLPVAELRDLHRRAAELLHRNGFPAAATALHLARAGAVRGSWAAQVLVTAADQSLDDDELSCAAQRLELAYRASRRAEDRASITMRLVGLEWRTDPSPRTKNFARLKSALYSGRVPQAELPQAILRMLWHGYTQQVDHALTRLAYQPPLSDAAARNEFLCAWLRYMHPIHADRHRRLFVGHPRAGEVATGGAESGRGRTVTRSTSDGGAACTASAADAEPPRYPPDPPTFGTSSTSPGPLSTDLLTALSVQHPPARLVGLAQRNLAAHRLDSSTLEALVVAVDCLIQLDRLDTADAWCVSLLAEAQARHAPTWRSIFAGLRAETLLRKGNLTAAADNAAMALNLVPAEHLGVWAGRPIAVLVRALTAQGRHAEAAAQLRRPVPRAMFESRFALPYLHAYGHHCLAIGQPESALRYFRRCGELMRQWNMDFGWLVPWRNDVAAAYLSAGEPRRAQAFATMHLKLIGGPDRHRTGAVSLRLLAAAGDPHRRVPLLRHAVAVARAGGDSLELSTALAELGRAHRSVGDVDKARPLLREAARLATLCGADSSAGCAARGERPVAKNVAREPLPGVCLTPTGVDTLSPAERRVAELAALGQRNREIADTLHITPSTVEQHLTRVYRKLSVARRGELRFVLAAHLPDAESAAG